MAITESNPCGSARDRAHSESGRATISALASELWPALTVFGVCFSTYLATLCPTVYVEGSGELIGAVHFLGTPHPTGYPLFALVGRLFSAALPFASAALKVNIASAFTAALAAAALAAFLRDRGCHSWVCAGSALAFGFSGTFWSQAVVAEVYGLSMLGAVAVIAVGVRAAERVCYRRFVLAAYVIGVAVTTHLSQVLILPGILVSWLLSLRRLRHANVGSPFAALGRALALTLPAAAGYSLILYLPLRSLSGPGFHWGPVDSAQLLWNHITAAEYRGAFFSMPAAGMWLNVGRWIDHLTSEFSIALCAVALWGLWSSFRRDRPTAVITAGAILGNLLVALNYHRDPNGIGVFFLLSFLGLALFLGFGLDDIASRLGRRLPSPTVPALVAILAAGVSLSTNAADADRRGIRIADSYGRDILAALPADAILLTEGDDASFILDYLHRVESVRPDVTLYMRNGRGTDVLASAERRLGKATRARLRQRYEQRLVKQSQTDRPVFFLFARQMPLKGFEFVPHGLCYEAKPARPRPQAGPSPRMSTAENTANIRDPWVRIIQGSYWFKLADHHAYRGEKTEAITALERAAEIAHDSRTMRYNVAVRLLKLGEYDKAWPHARAAIDIDPLVPGAFKLGSTILRNAGRQPEASALRAEAASWRSG